MCLIFVGFLLLALLAVIPNMVRCLPCGGGRTSLTMFYEQVLGVSHVDSFMELWTMGRPTLCQEPC
jgi:hypothetical protein